MGYELVHHVVFKDAGVYRYGGQERTLTPMARHALLIYAVMAKDDKAGECWPSLAWVANKMGVSTRSLKRYNDELLQSGRIKRIRESKSPKHSNHYFVKKPPYIIPSQGTTVAPDKGKDRGHPWPLTGDTCGQKQGTTVARKKSFGRKTIKSSRARDGESEENTKSECFPPQAQKPEGGNGALQAQYVSFQSGGGEEGAVPGSEVPKNSEKTSGRNYEEERFYKCAKRWPNQEGIEQALIVWNERRYPYAVMRKIWEVADLWKRAGWYKDGGVHCKSFASFLKAEEWNSPVPRCWR